MKGVIFSLLAMIFLILSGCSSQPGTPVQPAATAPQPATVPALAQTLLNQYGPPATGVVPISDSGEYHTCMPPSGPSGYNLYAISFIWGRLMDVNDSTMLPPVNWSGMLSISGPAYLRPKNTVSFESGQDSLPPQSDSTEIIWTSAISGRDFDGLSAIVLVKNPTTDSTPTMLTFATAPITLNLGLDKLTEYVAFYPVGTSGGVVVMARQIQFEGSGRDGGDDDNKGDTLCPKGSFNGNLVLDSIGANQGNVNGTFYLQNGVAFGTYEGSFTVDTAGNKMLTGEIKDTLGVTLATMKGRWHFKPDTCSTCGLRGEMAGWLKFADNGSGRFAADFGNDSLPPDQLSLPIVGRWERHCEESDDDSGHKGD